MTYMAQIVMGNLKASIEKEYINNNEISDYLHRSYLLIQEKLNRK